MPESSEIRSESIIRGGQFMGSKARVTGAVGCVVVLLIAMLLFGCEKNEWAKVQKTNTVEGYKAFVQKYPNGKFAAAANTAIEGIEWQKAEQANTIEAYEGFLASYSSSMNAATASERIAGLKEQKLTALEEEAINNLIAIQAAMESHAAKQKAAKKKVLYIACKPSPADGGTDAIADPWVDAGGFTEIGFDPAQPVLYRYEVALDRSMGYVATATGDLDGNGVEVKFTITKDSSVPAKSVMEEH